MKDLDPWDNVRIDGRDAPGLCTVSRVRSGIDVDVVFPFTAENWEEAQAWVDAIWKVPKVFRPGLTPVTAEHPALRRIGVCRVLVTRIAPPVAVDPPFGLEGLAFEWKMIKVSLVEVVE